MKVDPEHLPRVGRDAVSGAGAASRGRVNAAGSSPASGASSGSKGDGIVLTAEAGRFRLLRDRVRDLPESGQSERVAELKALVESGQYRVGGDKIANAMLGDEPTALLLGFAPSSR